jgi:hypothetical protein
VVLPYGKCERAEVPGEDAFVLLDVVRKDDMAKDPQRFVRRALEFLDHWLKEVRGT